MPVNIGQLVANAAAQAAQAATQAAVNGTVQELIEQSQAAMPQAISDLQPSEAEMQEALRYIPTDLHENIVAIHVGFAPDPQNPTKAKPVFAFAIGLPVGMAYGLLGDPDE